MSRSNRGYTPDSDFMDIYNTPPRRSQSRDGSMNNPRLSPYQDRMPYDTSMDDNNTPPRRSQSRDRPINNSRMSPYDQDGMYYDTPMDDYNTPPRRSQSHDRPMNNSRMSPHQDGMYYNTPDPYDRPLHHGDSRDQWMNTSRMSTSPNQDRMFCVVSLKKNAPTQDERFQPIDYNKNRHTNNNSTPPEKHDRQYDIAETGSVNFEHPIDRFHRKERKTAKKLITWKKALCVLIPLLLVVVIVLIVVLSPYASKSQPKTDQLKGMEHCQASAEAQRCGLTDFFKKLQNTLYKLIPHQIRRKPGVTDAEVRETFRPFNPLPSELKRVTDKTRLLFQELESISAKCSESVLKVRERRGIDEAKYLLKFNFAIPYSANYYNGDWMLGPNIYCWQPLCYINSALSGAFAHMKPKSLEDVTKLKDVLLLQKSAIRQYKDNLKLGIEAGMVRSQQACKAGLNAFKDMFFNTAFYGEKGILKDRVGKTLGSADFVENIEESAKSKWLRDNGENVTMSFQRYLVDYVGRPLEQLIKYLEFDHMFHCVPETISSGFANIPVSHVYTDGHVDTSRPTTQRLPTGEPLNGSVVFGGYILPFFTSNELTPEEVEELGYSYLKEVYAKAVAIAKQETGETDENEAVKKFREKLASREMFYNKDPFPAEESDKTAFRKCRENATLHCPERWKSMQSWKDASKKVVERYQSKLSEVFYTEPGPKKTTPKCGVKQYSGFNPSSTFHMYSEGNKDCSHLAGHHFPFFLENHGPVYDLHGSTVHEVSLGHHLEVQGFKENYRENCTDEITWLNTIGFVSPFSEGWATYSEFQLAAKDLNLLKNDLIQMYGIVRRQILRALECIINVGLHYNGMKAREALDLLDKWAWVTGSFAQKALMRYQSVPGATMTYLVGYTDFLEARTYAEAKLGAAFSLKELHYRMIHQGDTTLQYMKQYMKKYVDCASDPKEKGCEDFAVKKR